MEWPLEKSITTTVIPRFWNSRFWNNLESGMGFAADRIFNYINYLDYGIFQPRFWHTFFSKNIQFFLIFSLFLCQNLWTCIRLVSQTGSAGQQPGEKLTAALNLQQTSVCDRVRCSVEKATKQRTRSQTIVCCRFSATKDFNTARYLLISLI